MHCLKLLMEFTTYLLSLVVFVLYIHRTSWYLPAPKLQMNEPLSLKLLSRERASSGVTNFTFQAKCEPRVLVSAINPVYSLACCVSTTLKRTIAIVYHYCNVGKDGNTLCFVL